MNCISDSLKSAVGGVELAVPVVIASGIWPYESGLWRGDLVGDVGAICSKAITVERRKGNDGIRVWETPSGILNSIGLQNEGIDHFMEVRLPDLKKRGIPVLLNVSMESSEGLEYMMKLIAGRSELVDAVELNVSCPNVDCGCMSWGVDPGLTAQATEMVRAKWGGPLWVKLTPQAPDIPAVAKAAESAGATAVVAGNTWLGMAIDTKRGRPVFNRRVAGLSGPAIFPLALRVVWDVAGAVKIPVVGCGGVRTSDDALAMIMAGASAVEVGAALFSDFSVLKEIREGLQSAVAARKTNSITDLVGLARK